MNYFKILLLLIFLSDQPICFARDFIVEFKDENYKEVCASYAYSPVVYHSIQVSTSAGSKLLVVTGDDFNYRSWLRQYIAHGKAFIVKVPDEAVDQFVGASVFDVDIKAIHPLNLGLYKKAEETSGPFKNTITGPAANFSSVQGRSGHQTGNSNRRNQ